jgi:excinuclease ABC subunit B
VAESPDDVAAVVSQLEDEMQEAAAKLEFEKAALIRDQIDALRSGNYRKMGGKAPRKLRPTRAGSAGGG